MNNICNIHIKNVKINFWLVKLSMYNSVIILPELLSFDAHFFLMYSHVEEKLIYFSSFV